MDQLFKFSRAQLIEAFKIYNAEVIKSPENFGTIDETEATAGAQVDKLLEILQTLK